MRKMLILPLAAALSLLLCAPACAGAAPGVSAAACAVLHPDSGTVIYAKNADTPMLIASTTKIMTALVVLECCEPDEPVNVTREHCDVEGSSMYLAPGGEYTVRELLYGLLLASGNDAALALAEHCAGSVGRFAELMNETASLLGLENSHFDNPHGLDTPEHRSSASDLALIMAAAMDYELFRQISGASSYTVGANTYHNHNRLLGASGIVAGKTGYTKAAGRALVTCCEREGMRLICVTLSAPDDWDDHERLYDWAYSAYTDTPPEPGGAVPESVPVVSGLSDSVEVSPASAPGLLRSVDETVDVRCELPNFVYAPVRAGDVLGRLTVSAGGRTAETELIAASDVPANPDEALSRLELLKRAWYLVNRCGGYRFSGY